MRRSIRNERGQSMLEMAIVLPLLLSIVFGIIEFGNIYSTQIRLNNVARQAARTAVVGLPADDNDVEDDMEDMAEELGMTGTTVDITRPGTNVTASVEYAVPLLTGYIIGVGTKDLEAVVTMKAE